MQDALLRGNMKKVFIVFKRDRYTSDPDGQPLVNPMMPSLMEALGGATSMRWEVTIYARSSTNARLDIAIFEGTKPDPRPSANKFAGVNIGSTPQRLTTLGITNIQVNGPFHGIVDATVAGKSNSPVVGTQEWVDAEVRVSADFD